MRRFVIYIIYPAWSFLINVLYWVFHIFSLKKALKRKAKLKREARSWIHICNILDRFVWKQDSCWDWVPWIVTIVNNELHDDCDGAAVLAKWLLEQIWASSGVFFLVRGFRGHAVCITDDRKHMFSNGKAFSMDPDNWQQDVLNRFHGEYNKIIG